jgi:tetratricopeptide (TPR) repeat protein
MSIFQQKPRQRALVVSLVLSSLWLGGCVPTKGNNLVVKHFADNDFTGSRQLASQFLEKDPSDADNIGLVAWNDFMLGRWPQALAGFRTLREEHPNNIDGYLGKAWVLLKRGNLDEAEKYMDKAEIWAGQAQYFMMRDIRGWLALKRGDLDLAEKYFDQAEKQLLFDDWAYIQIPKEVEASWSSGPPVSKGWLAVTRGDWETAEKYFRQGLERDPLCYHCRDGLARAALVRNDRNEAIRQALEGLKAVNYDNGLLGLLDYLLALEGDADLTVRTYAALAKARPDSARYAAAHASALLSAGRYADAEKTVREALQKWPDDSLLLSTLARVQYTRTYDVADGWKAYYVDLEDALERFTSKQEEARSNGNPAADDGRGWTLLALGRYQEAADAFHQALDIQEDFPYSRNGLVAASRALAPGYGEAWGLVYKGDLEAAAERFEQGAAEAESEDARWPMQVGRAWVDYYQGDYDSARKGFEGILGRHPYAHPAATGAGLCALQQGDLDAAARYLRAAAHQFPNQSLSTYVTAAAKFHEQEDWDRVLEFIDRGLAVYPYSADLQWLLAKVYKDMDDDGLAAYWAGRASANAARYIDPVLDDLKLEKWARDGLLHAHAWNLYFARDNEAALKRFEEYIRNGGDDLNAERGRAFALFRLGRLEDASTALMRVIEKDEGRLLPIVERVPIPGSDEERYIVYDARTTLGWAYLRMNAPDVALKHFRIAIDEHPDWVDALTGLGYALAAEGKTKQAEKYFRKALDLQPGYPDARSGLAALKK